jgi:glycosyltransferase involved in cell wall biosynthesis
MIVKNERGVILRCLESVRPLIDYVLIEDTGSSDGTQEVITEYLQRQDLRGEVFDESWRDFGHNRSLALARLRRRRDVDYALLMDADDIVVFDPGFDQKKFKKILSSDQYDVRLIGKNANYQRTLICSNRRDFKFRGVLHEFLAAPPGIRRAKLVTGFHISSLREGARSADPEKYRKDAEVLERALEKERDSFLRARYTFYLAQSYADYGENEKAAGTYLKRTKLGYWNQEIYVSFYRAGTLLEEMGRSIEEVLPLYVSASQVCRDRAEALHAASRLCRLNNRFGEGYEFAMRGSAITQPSAALFCLRWIYEYGLLDELAVNAYWVGAYREAFDTSQKLLTNDQLPLAMAAASYDRAGRRQRSLRRAASISAGCTRCMSNSVSLKDAQALLDHLLPLRKNVCEFFGGSASETGEKD